jgi:hypothetical protein
MIYKFDFAPAKNFIKPKPPRPRRRPGAPGARRSRRFSLAEVADNRPQFQLRVGHPKTDQAPERRQKNRMEMATSSSAVPAGLISFCSSNPQLKLRTILIRRFAI